MQKQEVKRNEKKIFEPTAGAVHADDPAAGHGAGAAPIQSGLTQGAIFSAAANGLGTSYATGATVTMPASAPLYAIWEDIPPIVTTGTISGTVTDGINPVSGATVSLTASGSVYSAITGTDGSYSIANVPAGTGYTVTAGKSGYNSGNITNVAVTANIITSGINIALTTAPADDSSGYTPARTITVTESGSNLFSGSKGGIQAQANMGNAFSDSVEVKVTNADEGSFGLSSGSEVYPFDISLYRRGTNTKLQPREGYAVTISLPVPDELLDRKEQISVVHKSEGGRVTTLASRLEQKNHVWYLIFEATDFSPYALVVSNTVPGNEPADVPAGVPYYLDADGSQVFIGFAANSKYIAPSGVTVLFMENSQSFTDVSGHWAEEYINFVAEREIFAGTGPNTFSPETGMTRAMFATVVGRLYERSYGKIKSSAIHSFNDCDYADYYGKYVDWCAENGIIEGVGASQFAPGRAITREEMAAILYRFTDFLGALPGDAASELHYPDSASISGWAQRAALYCQTTGIISGRSGGLFAPQETASRAEVAAIVQRLVEMVMK